MLLIGTFAKPLQLILILIITGLSFVHFGAAAAFTVSAVAVYAWQVFVPPSDSLRNPRLTYRWRMAYGSSASSLASVTFTSLWLVDFLVVFWRLPVEEAILRWLAFFGLSYYIGGVAMGFLMVYSLKGVLK